MAAAERTTSIRALAAALAARDGCTGGHIERVSDLGLLLAAALAPDDVADPQLAWGFLLHDVGKLAVPDSVLQKPSSLDDEERAAALERRAGELGLPFYRISAVSGAGLPDLLEEMWRQVAAARAAEAAEIDLEGRPGDPADQHQVKLEDRLTDGPSDNSPDAQTDEPIPTR